MIQRIFHPIGQGAFYSERHDGFNIVYDCGEFFETNKSERLVKNGFEKGDTIDILFISHFDADHVNRIKFLKKFKIKKVIMPLLHDDEEIFLNHFYNAIGRNDIIQMIEDPKAFFGKDTDIIKVRDGDANNDNTPDEITIEQLKDGCQISSGVIIKSVKADWVFVPYNNKSGNRETELRNRFKKKGLDINKFQKELDYALENATKVKEIYKELAGGINANSMILYSGPTIEGYSIENNCCLFYEIINRAGCVYTGDMNLNEFEIDVVYSKYWNFVGTIQIPHHGSKHNFKIDPFKTEYYMCPVSYGNTNFYDHPSLNVLSQLHAEYCCVKHVTENVNTIYIQNISTRI
jgi:beta-lactamase superfamily II metal-dependent hydrolase